MAKKVVIGTIKVFDKKDGRGVIVPRKMSKAPSSLQPVSFKAPEKTRFRVGQLVRFVVDPSSDRRAEDVAVLSEMGD